MGTARKAKSAKAGRRPSIAGPIGPGVAQRNDLVEKHLDVVRNLARVVSRRLPGGAELEEDLYQNGVIGLIQAAERFDPSRGLAFNVYCLRRVAGAMWDSVRGRNYPLQSTSIEQLLGDPRRICNDLHDHPGAQYTNCADTPWWTPSETPNYEEQIDRERAASRALETLPARQRRVVEMHYLEDRSLASLPPDLGCSKSYVKKLHVAAIRSLRAA